MGDNVIYTNDDEAIGFYKDLRKVIIDQIHQLIEQKDYENASSLLDELMDLEQFSECEELLITSDNNVMGFTVEKYKEKLCR